MSHSGHHNGAPRRRKPFADDLREKAICPKCKNDQLRFIGVGAWKADHQYFDFEPCIDVFCLSCLSVTLVDWVPLPSTPSDSP